MWSAMKWCHYFCGTKHYWSSEFRCGIFRQQGNARKVRSSAGVNIPSPFDPFLARWYIPATMQIVLRIPRVIILF